jgi:hypothetical protein
MAAGLHDLEPLQVLDTLAALGERVVDRVLDADA